MPKPHVSLHRRTKADSISRPKHGKPLADIHAQTPILDLVTPLRDICMGWSAAEVSAGRRLVRFSKVQDGRRLIVSCEPIKPEEYRESDSVISCIYREEVDMCYVTSVDIIFLLERLTSSDFPVEEKNRIRRNLEGLRPTTVSKHKSGFEDFFQRIMEFPDPKPRNIEKDLKVFEWASLDQALDKILSKYTIDTSPLADATDVSEDLSPVTPSDDAELQFPYPDGASAALPEDFQFLQGADDSEAYCLPVDSASAYQVYSPEFTSVPVHSANSSSWNTDYKAGSELINPPDFGFDSYVFWNYKVPQNEALGVAERYL